MSKKYFAIYIAMSYFLRNLNKQMVVTPVL